VATYSGRKDVVNVVLPESVTEIRKANFSECSNLEKIYIPKGVTRIEAGAFSGCSKLASAEIPEGIVRIEPNTFYMCKKLASVKLPASLSAIGTGAFMLCGSLKKIELPRGLAAIDDEAFHSSGLREVSLPRAVLRVGERAFAVCKSLKKAVLCDTISFVGADAFDNDTKIIYPGEAEDFRRANLSNTNYPKLVCTSEPYVKKSRGLAAFNVLLLVAIMAAAVMISVYVPGSLHWCIAIGGGIILNIITSIISVKSNVGWVQGIVNILELVACVVLFFVAISFQIEYPDVEANTTIYENSAVAVNLLIYIIGLAFSALIGMICIGKAVSDYDFDSLARWIFIAINIFEIGIGVFSLIFSAFDVMIFFAAIALLVIICAIIYAIWAAVTGNL
jgi:hypothetical protein